MTHPLDRLPPDALLDADWDAQDIRDLVQTTPLCYDGDGIPTGYQAEQLFGLEGQHLGRAF
jgi:hypothetical protein